MRKINKKQGKKRGKELPFYVTQRFFISYQFISFLMFKAEYLNNVLFQEVQSYL